MAWHNWISGLVLFWGGGFITLYLSRLIYDDLYKRFYFIQSDKFLDKDLKAFLILLVLFLLLSLLLGVGFTWLLIKQFNYYIIPPH